MSMTNTPSGERIQIGFFGCTNAGKSSLINAVTGQEVALVSEVKGTTTDPVQKTMELLPLGPVVLIDTPGLDDVSELGLLRQKRTRQMLNKTDLAVLVLDGTSADTFDSEANRQLLTLFREKNIPFVIALNKADLLDDTGKIHVDEAIQKLLQDDLAKTPVLYNSALSGQGIWELKESLAKLGSTETDRCPLIADRVQPGDVVVLVVPIDKAAPKGRLILPQQMVIRELLEKGAMPLVVRETELEAALGSLKEAPALVITDSQAFKKVSAIVPDDIMLTSFSILMARHKGFLEVALDGVAHLKRLKSGDTVLISEGCTHHRQCGDIGTEKLPKWIQEYAGCELKFEFTSGAGFPDHAEAIQKYAMVIHCGGCMLPEKEVRYRMQSAVDAGVPFTNYGTAIAQINSILNRSIQVLAPCIQKNNLL